MPLQRRLPKRGFINIFRKEVAVVNLKDLNRFESSAVWIWKHSRAPDWSGKRKGE